MTALMLREHVYVPGPMQSDLHLALPLLPTSSLEGLSLWMITLHPSTPE